MALVLDGSANTIGGLAVGGLPDGIVDTDMLAANAVTAAKATGSAKGLTTVDLWRQSSDRTVSTSSGSFVTSGWERCDTDGYAGIGSAMTESSGVFTFPETGIWRIEFRFNFMNNVKASRYVESGIWVTTDNSSYGEACTMSSGIGAQYHHTTNTGSHIFDVTNTSTHKVKFQEYAYDTDTQSKGSTSLNNSHVSFTRLGDT
tara:strand:- start:95 stop:700 length:606 start_codon:yes stop_codon:yes gene_type:complete